MLSNNKTPKKTNSRGSVLLIFVSCMGHHPHEGYQNIISHPENNPVGVVAGNGVPLKARDSELALYVTLVFIPCMGHHPHEATESSVFSLKTTRPGMITGNYALPPRKLNKQTDGIGVPDVRCPHGTSPP